MLKITKSYTSKIDFYFFKKVIKDRILKDIRNLFEHEEKGYYKPVRVGNFWSNNYMEYKSNDDRNKTLSVGIY